MQKIFSLVLCGGLVAFLTGCEMEGKQVESSPQPAPAVAAAPVAAAQPAAAVAAVPAMSSTIRVKAGAATPFKDSTGNVWLPDSGFEGGDVVERPELAIANTKDQALYQSEHYSMTAFSCKLPNGKYTAKLHFAETFEGITGAGERVFSFNVQGHEFKNFDVFVKAGGAARAYIESVPVEVTNGVFKIDFVSNVENPQICGIEIIPAS